MSPALVSLNPDVPFLEFFPLVKKRSRETSSFDEITEALNTDSCLKESSTNEPNSLVVIGDLHGNWLALIQYLLLEKIISVTHEDFYELSQIANNTYIQQLKHTETKYKSWALKALDLSNEISVTEEELERLESLPENQPLLQETKNTLFLQETNLYMVENYRIKLGEQFHILGEKVKADATKYKEILARIKVIDTKKIILLAGDELFDRGHCDWNTKMLFEYLRKKSIKLRFLLSNHAVEALYNYLTKNWLIDTPPRLMRDDLPQFYNSAINEKILLDFKFVTQKTIENLTKYWVDRLNLITYSRTESAITIYTHAPIGLETIKALAKKFNINYIDNTIENLCDTINNINQFFHASLKKSSIDPESFVYQFDEEVKTHNNLLNEEGISYLDIISNDAPILPLLNTLWNRNHKFLNRPLVHPVGNYKLNFSYGHELPQESPAENLWELDNTWGKTCSPCTAYYTFDAFKITPECTSDQEQETAELTQEILPNNTCQIESIGQYETMICYYYGGFSKQGSYLKSTLENIKDELLEDYRDELAQYEQYCFDQKPDEEKNQIKNQLWNTHQQSHTEDNKVFSSINILPPRYIEGYIMVHKDTSLENLQKLIKEDMRKNAPIISLYHNDFNTAPQNLRYLKVTGETFSASLLPKQRKNPISPVAKSPATIATQTPPVDTLQIGTKNLGHVAFFPIEKPSHDDLSLAINRQAQYSQSASLV